MSATKFPDTTLTAKILADITECRRHVRPTFATCWRQTKISVIWVVEPTDTNLNIASKVSNPATFSNPAIVCDSARLSNPATPSNPAIFSDPSTLSNADDIRLMSPSQSKDVHNNNSTPTASNPLEGKTTAVIAVMRGNPKDGYTCLRSNNHCKQRMMRVPIRQWF